MFTNWLTSPTTTTSSLSLTNSITSSNLLGQLPNNLMATPPDIILEVGPSPTVRFVAHSSLLAMHSGYLRSAIRIDENLLIGAGCSSNNNNSNSNNGLMDYPPVFLTNVTPEQFGPLLTYMYTGYLDLTLENIFGVLLATHVLHMPRALEICRAFLARSQSEGYLNGGFLNEINSNISKSISGCKIIRPIASKPIISNLGFIVPPQMQNISITSSTGTPFRSLNNSNMINNNSNDIMISKTPPLAHQQQPQTSAAAAAIVVVAENSNLQKSENLRNSSSPNNLIKLSKSSPISKDHHHHNQTTSVKRSPKLKRIIEKQSSLRIKTPIPRKDNNSSSSLLTTTNQNPSSTTGTTIPSNNNLNSTNQDNENKIIIDVASCDGPVRFRRVLNEAYGRQPDSVHLPIPQHERSHQSLSYSFHQQMAKNICQQRQQQQQQQQQQNNNLHHHSEESENSEDVRNSQQNCNGGSQQQQLTNQNSSSSIDVYNCVYCKHTFKSQYCYQKHAKRHLNPLSLEHGEGIILAPAITTFGELTKDEKIISRTAIVTSSPKQTSTIETIGSNGNSNNNNNNNNNATTRSSTRASNSNNNNNNNGNSSIVSNTLNGSGGGGSGGKREVRPLDMNVQYYPCKTCGSKFPSYYFVHKHRKMCHANEEN